MQFNYVVRTKEGEMQSGIVEAADRQRAVITLQSKNLIVLNLQSSGEKAFFSRDFAIFQSVKSKDLVSFSRQLSILFSAQVPLLSALRALVKQTDNAYFRDIIFEVANDVEGGTVFSKALSRHPKVFSSFFVNMVKSGEASGSLEGSLNYLADYLEKQFYLISRVRGAMIYPAFILFGFVVAAILMMVLVVPKLTGFLEETGQELPIVTKIVIAASDFLIAWWYLLAVAVAGGASYLGYSLKTSASARKKWDELKLNLPVFGKILQKVYLTRFADNLSTLIQGGLSILQALQVTADVVGNAVFQSIVLQAKEEVRVGNSLSSSLAKHKEIPPLVSQMVATGEQTGSMDFILKKMSQFYPREVDNTVDTISQLIEPILILLIGAGVAVLIAAILMPIYNIAGNM